MGTLLGILLVVVGGLMSLWVVGLVLAGAVAIAVLFVKVALPLLLIYAGYRLISGPSAAY
jgi:hypothetical protein